MKKTKCDFRILFLLISILFLPAKMVMAQDTIPKLIISEARMEFGSRNYMELTNVGDTAVNLMHFQAGSLVNYLTAYVHRDGHQAWLPDYELQPGESFLIAVVQDGADNYPEIAGGGTNKDILANVDMEVHMDESGDFPYDSISPHQFLLQSHQGRNGYYIEYHTPGGDSVVIDAVKNDIQANGMITNNPSDVAGVFEATWHNVLVRKANIKKGNTDWELSRGVSSEDSEWLVIPFRNNFMSKDVRYFTTIGHHGIAELNNSTLSSDLISVDFDNAVLSVPWGLYRDSVMNHFELGNGIAWKENWGNSMEDSLYYSLRTGDTLAIKAVGETLQVIDFHIEVLPPTTEMNHVLPKYRRSVWEDGNIGYSPVFSVTENMPGMDSILDVSFGLRVDTLFKYLEKPSNANWEIVWVDGDARPDLKRGDILKVTAENGDVKEYFIAASETPEASNNAYLRNITWPDVPEITMLSPAWGGDEVIPGFDRFTFSYAVKVPYGLNTVPALKAAPEDQNAKISYKRATSLTGSVSDRTTVITVTATDDSTERVYSVMFEKEIPSVFVQPFNAEPIFTQFGFREFNLNSQIEICNPGNQPLDLSRYLITYHRGGQIASPAASITRNALEYGSRNRRLVPGYDFVSELDWASKPGFLVSDLDVDPIVPPGDVFVFGRVGSKNVNHAYWVQEMDIIYKDGSYDFSVDPGTEAKVHDTPGDEFIMDRLGGQFGDPVHIFKILNDSILEGKKGLTDPADFQLIEVIGDYSGSAWNINGNEPIVRRAGMYRKPQFWKADTIINNTFGNTPDSSQWIVLTQAMLADLGYGWPEYDRYVVLGLGSHELDQITEYKSTVSSTTYIASDGYVSPQSIIGVVENTTVENFINNIIKADTGQYLQLISGENGVELASDAIVNNSDTLVVVSADSANMTKYALTVTEKGLDDNAVLTAKDGSGLVIEYTGSEGTITGFSYGITLNSLLENIEKPATAVMSVIDDMNNLVPLKVIKNDSVTYETQVSDAISLEVVAQNGTTKITYQLMPETDPSSAKLYSSIYEVDQDARLVDGIPDNIRVETFLENIFVNEGATMILTDKEGNERQLGNVAYDDMVVVSSSDGNTVNNYFLKFTNDERGLAYVTSDILLVDQTALLISEIEHATTVDGLMTLLVVAPGATAEIVDENGSPVSSGILEDSYKLKVTSETGTLVVIYDLSILTSIGLNRDLEDIKAYPNPTAGEVYISGLRENCTITVIDVNGRTVKVIEPDQIFENRVSISDQPNGIYFVTVKSGTYHLKTMMVIKK
jgi:hypothetical protein